MVCLPGVIASGLWLVISFFAVFPDLNQVFRRHYGASCESSVMLEK